MKLRRTTIAATAVVAAVGLAACGGSDSSGGGSGGAFKVGIKFDQPGMGLKEGSKYTGFDVDVAKYVAKAARPQGQRHPVRRGADPAARDADLHRPGQLHRRHLLDHRRAQAEGLVRRPVLHRRPGPARPHRRDGDHRPGHPDRQEALLGQGLHLGREGQGQVPRRPAAGVRHLLQVRRGAQRQGRRRPDHRQHDPRRLRQPARPTRASSSSSARPSPRRSTASA